MVYAIPFLFNRFKGNNFYLCGYNNLGVKIWQNEE